MREDRLAFFLSDHLTRHPTGTTLHIRETSQEGEANIAVQVQGDEALSLRLSGDGFPFFKTKKSADGHILVKNQDSSWSAYVIECKKTLNENSWSSALEQLRAAAVRLQMIADFLGITISQWFACVAYREERISPEHNKNPIHLKPLVGRPDGAAEMRKLSHQWQNNQVDTFPFAQQAPLRRVSLDQQGAGAMTV